MFYFVNIKYKYQNVFPRNDNLISINVLFGKVLVYYIICTRFQQIPYLFDLNSLKIFKISKPNWLKVIYRKNKRIMFVTKTYERKRKRYIDFGGNSPIQLTSKLRLKILYML